MRGMVNQFATDSPEQYSSGFKFRVILSYCLIKAKELKLANYFPHSWREKKKIYAFSYGTSTK